MGTRRRISALEERAIEEKVEERLEREFYEFFGVLEERLPRGEFLRVLEIAARGR